MNSKLFFSRDFFLQDTVKVAREILGSILIRKVNGKTLSGRIVEAEAYLHDDPACHAYRGMTPRTNVMFGEAGHSYVYFTYGMHHCCNIVTNHISKGEAVLIRALEPLDGIETMYLNRGEKAKKNTDLLSGPGKICQAMQLTKTESGIDLLESDMLYLEKSPLLKGEVIAVSTRVGLTAAVEKPWRFFIKGNPNVSKGKPSG